MQYIKVKSFQEIVGQTILQLNFDKWQDILYLVTEQAVYGIRFDYHCDAPNSKGQLYLRSFNLLDITYKKVEDAKIYCSDDWGSTHYTPEINVYLKMEGDERLQQVFSWTYYEYRATEEYPTEAYCEIWKHVGKDYDQFLTEYESQELFEEIRYP